MRGTFEQRFMDKVIPEPNSGCWLWLGAQHKQGYGQFAIATKEIVLAHRASWLIHYGWMPHRDIKVCHSCDTPQCVNPDHLFLGTQKENMADCVKKGRLNPTQQIGSQNPAAIFTDNDVRNILRDRRRLREIAAHYECAVSTISMIKTGRNWPHLFSEWQSHEATARAERRL